MLRVLEQKIQLHEQKTKIMIGEIFKLIDNYHKICEYIDEPNLQALTGLDLSCERAISTFIMKNRTVKYLPNDIRFIDMITGYNSRLEEILLNVAI